MRHTIKNLLFGIIQTVPKRFPEVRVKAQQGTGRLGQSDGFPAGRAARFIGHGQGTKVEDRGIRQKLPVKLFGAEVHVRAGIRFQQGIALRLRTAAAYRRNRKPGW